LRKRSGNEKRKSKNEKKFSHVISLLVNEVLAESAENAEYVFSAASVIFARHILP
jgi:hypothetical protein